MASTGPKISSRAMVMSFVHVAEDRRSHVAAGCQSLGPTGSARHELGALGDAGLDERLDPSPLGELATGPISVSGSDAPTDADVGGELAGHLDGAAMECGGTSMRVGALQDWPLLRMQSQVPCARPTRGRHRRG